MILCTFTPTYASECTFSKIKFIRNSYRTRLTNDNVEALLRLAVISQPSNIDAIPQECDRFRDSTTTNTGNRMKTVTAGEEMGSEWREGSARGG
ncbi:hypothetical protein J6590_103946 [Homalodisca vitripennis]|nr:hypothetical protein J6590_103946 [Homalodisca vitripennis]